MQTDLGYWDKPFIKLMEKTFGMLGAAAHQIVSCKIGQTSSRTLSIEEVLALRDDENWLDIIDNLIARGWLVNSNGQISSPGIDSDYADLSKKSTAASEAAKSRWNKENNNLDAGALQPHSEAMQDCSLSLSSLDISKEEQSATYTKTWKGKRLWLDGEDYASLLMNHYHSNEQKLLKDLPFFDDLATKKNMNFANSEQCAAQIRYYIGQKEVFKQKEPEQRKDNRPRPKPFVPVWEREKQEQAK